MSYTRKRPPKVFTDDIEDELDKTKAIRWAIDICFVIATIGFCVWVYCT